MTEETKWRDVIPWTEADREKGECPVPGDEVVWVVYDRTIIEWAASDIDWSASAAPPILAYRRKIKPNVGWLNIYNDGASYLHKTRGEATQRADSARIACIKVTWREGQFDKEDEQ